MTALGVALALFLGINFQPSGGTTPVPPPIQKHLSEVNDTLPAEGTLRHSLEHGLNGEPSDSAALWSRTEQDHCPTLASGVGNPQT
jgi:hypothetical protein